MNIQQMKYYIQLYEDGSFSRASSRNFISQQGLSRLIKITEEKYGANLFTRSVKGLQPTLQGSIVYEHYKKIVREYEDMLDQLSYVQKKDATLKIGVTSIMASAEYSSNMLQFYENNSRIRMELIALGHYDCEKYLEMGLVDFCISIRPDNLLKFHFIHIWTDKFVAYMHADHELAAHKKIKLDDIMKKEVILLSKDTKGGTQLWDGLRARGYYPHVVLATSQMCAAFEYVKKNKGIAVLPQNTVPNEYKNDDSVICREIEDFTCVCEMGAFHLAEKKLSDDELKFIRYFTEVMNSKGIA